MPGASGQSVHERAVMTALTGLTALTPLFVVLMHRGLAPLILTMGFIVVTRAEPWRKGVPHFFLRPDFKAPVICGAYAFLALCVWIAASALWSPLGEKWELGINLFFPAAAGGAIIWEIARRPAGQSARMATVFAIAIAASAALLLLEGVAGAPLRALTPPADLSPERHKDFTALGRGVTAIAPAVFPAAAIALRRTGRRLAAAGIVAAALAAALSLSISANVFALSLGAAAALLALAQPKRTLAGLIWFALAVLFVAPFAAAALPAEMLAERFNGDAPASWLQRLAVWKAAGAAAVDALPFGRGVDYARAWSAAGATVDLPGALARLPAMPTHPHNVFLQIWLELGLPGVAAFAAFVYCGGRALMRVQLPRPVAAGAAGSIAAVAASLMVEASLWQVWRISAMTLAAFGVSLSYFIYQNGVRLHSRKRNGVT
ncbi:MAG: O-antigen ligase family protein [Parvularculaceae bacterium]